MRADSAENERVYITRFRCFGRVQPGSQLFARVECERIIVTDVTGARKTDKRSR